MPTTKAVSATAVHHRTLSSVEIEQQAERITHLAIGARKQRAAPKGQGEHQLRRDVLCGKNKAYYTTLRIGYADLRDSESIDDVTAPLYAMIHLFQEFVGPDPEMAFDAYIRIENEIRSEQTRLEIEYLCGDRSEPLKQKLDLLYGKHARYLDTRGRRALWRRSFGDQIGRGDSPRAA